MNYPPWARCCQTQKPRIPSAGPRRGPACPSAATLARPRAVPWPADRAVVGPAAGTGRGGGASAAVAVAVPRPRRSLRSLRPLRLKQSCEPPCRGRCRPFRIPHSAFRICCKCYGGMPTHSRQKGDQKRIKTDEKRRNPYGIRRKTIEKRRVLPYPSSHSRGPTPLTLAPGPIWPAGRPKNRQVRRPFPRFSACNKVTYSKTRGPFSGTPGRG
jgi:hypothetical protein